MAEVNHVHPSMVQAVFDTWEQAEMLRVPPSQQYVIVAGRMYQRWTGASGLSLFTTQGGAMWAPPIDDIRATHFLRGGVTHQQAWERAIAWAGAYAETVPIVTTADRVFGLPLTIDGRGPQWQIERPLQVTSKAASFTFLHGAFKLVGDLWTDADPYADWTFHDYAAAAMTAVEVENATREQFYRVRRSDSLFVCAGAASKVNFLYPKIDCNQKGGGIKMAANGSIVGAHMVGVAGNGISHTGGGAVAVECDIRQWQIGDPEYFDPEAYTGCGILAVDTDLYIQNCKVSWARELCRLEKTNNVVRDGHYYNGSQQYKAVDRATMSDEANEALYDYFVAKGNPYGWASPADARAQDFDPRPHHIGFVTAARRDQADYEANPTASPAAVLGNTRQDNAFFGIYIDNLHFDFHTNGWNVQNLAYGLKKSSSLSPDIHALIRYFAPAAMANPRFILGKSQPLVESVNFSPDYVNKHLIQMLPGYFDEAWQGDYSAFNADELDNWISSVDPGRGMGLSAGNDTTHLTLAANENPDLTWYNPAGPGAYIGFRDSATTDRAMLGVVANEIRIKALGGAKMFGVDTETGQVSTPGLPTYADNAAAVTGGLSAGDLYQTASGDLRIRV